MNHLGVQGCEGLRPASFLAGCWGGHLQRTAGSARKGGDAVEAAPCYACAAQSTGSCDMQEDHLRRAADGARRRRDAAEAAATPDERVALNAAKAERQKALRKQQASQGLAVQVFVWLLSCFLLCPHEKRARGTQASSRIARLVCF